jgi:YHS domain-containing protein
MKRSILFPVVLGFAAAFASAQVNDGSDFNLDDNGIAIGGYDPVAYFALGEAVPGNEDISAEHNGATFLFSTEENRQVFLENPEQYVPAYGGWCAWAASNGYLATVDPEQFVIQDNRLFLNYNGRVNRRFARDLDERIRQADDNWPDLSEEAAGR